MSRYQPPPPSRERTPPRFSDRRPSATYHSSSGQFGIRSSSDANQSLLPSREPPRGPKADASRHPGPLGIASRGRGNLAGRPDYRDRDRDRDRDRNLRDSRDAPAPFRRDNDRPDWLRRDRDPAGDRDVGSGRDNRSYVGRDRSASPPRSRRDSKDASSNQSFRLAESSLTWYGASGRGGPLTRGRGRADWDRGRGRSTVMTDRDAFKPRSRSREGWWDRDRDRDRIRDNEVDRRDKLDKRDLDRSLEREGWSRESDPRKRERSRSHHSSSQIAGPITTPSSIAIHPINQSHPNNSEKGPQRMSIDSARRYSLNLTTTSQTRDVRQEGEKVDYFSSKSDAYSRDSAASRAFSPAAAPQVPAFGSSLDLLKPAAPSTNSQTPQTDKPPTPSQPPSAPESSSARQRASFQPPRGPKADRALQSGTFRESKGCGPEVWAKQEPQARIARPSMIAGSSKHTSDQFPSAPSHLEDRGQPIGASNDLKSTQAIPLGPKAGISPTARQRFGAGQPAAPSTPPAAPSRPSAMNISPANLRSAASINLRSQVPQVQRNIQPRVTLNNNTWKSPEYKQPRPSIMNKVPTKSFQAEQRDKGYPSAARKSNLQLVTSPGQMSRTFVTQQPETPAPFGEHNDRHVHVAAEAKSTEHGESAIGQTQKAEDHRDIALSIGPSSEEEGEEEDGLDEEDFAHSERKFQKEMMILERKKPAPLLEDCNIVELLLRIQMLGIIVHGAVPSGLQEEPAMTEIEALHGRNRVGLMFPEVQDAKDEAFPPAGRLLSDPPVNPFPTPPIEDLPFLVSQKSAQFEVYEEDQHSSEIVTRLLEEDIERTSWAIRENLEHCCDDFTNLYRPWKIMVLDIEQQHREEIPLTPAPASPQPPPAPLPTPTPLMERTRGSRNTTELDVQNVLKESERSAREEQERRDREGKSRPNLDIEAIVPAMLDPPAAGILAFKDTNQLIPFEFALDVFSFLPPQDDFTAEEQKTFINAFIQYPKKWSRIADSLPGRDYQQCILHYYLTKDTAKYKGISSKKPTKKGRRGRTAGTRPRSTALISDSLAYDGDETEGLPVPVTDTGRPKRAAAPTFGDGAPDGDNPLLVPTVSKRTGGPAKEVVEGQVAEKATGRGRRPGTGPRGPRKSKAQKDAQQTQQMELGTVSGPLPERIEREPNQPSKAEKPLRGGDLAVLDVDEIQGLGMHKRSDVETDRGRLLLLNGDLSVSVGSGSAAGALQPSSYWSVPEQQKFPSLLAYFGRDFEAIASFMKSKTMIMVKNYYGRKIADGARELEMIAQEAEDKKEEGESMGAPPTPAAPPKRRYDATPSSMSGPGVPRPQVIADVTMLDGEVPVANNNSLVDDFAAEIPLQRRNSDLVVVPSRFTQPAPSRASPLIALKQHAEEASHDARSQTLRQQQSRGVQGPRSGFFLSEDPREVREVRKPPAAPIPIATPRPAQVGPPTQQVEKARVEQSQLPVSLVPHRGLAANPAQSIQPQYHTAPPPTTTSKPPSYCPPKGLRSAPAKTTHLRHISSTTPASSLSAVMKQEQDVPTFRRRDSQNYPQYQQAPARSPSGSGPPLHCGLHVETLRPSSTPIAHPAPPPPRPEPPKPTPAKRSNIMSILNDEPAEPIPRKRPSLEQPSSQPLNSPPSAPFSNQASTTQQSHLPTQRGDVPASAQQAALSQYSQSQNQGLSRYAAMVQQQSQAQPHYSTNVPQATQGGRDWLSRWDPRQPVQANAEPQGPRTQNSTATAYGVQGPSALQPANGTASQPASQQQYHHRMVLGQLNHPGHAPSPPPPQGHGLTSAAHHQQQLQNQPQLHRSSSTSSQHSRVSSYSHGQALQNMPAPPSKSNTPAPGPSQQGHTVLSSSGLPPALAFASGMQPPTTGLELVARGVPHHLQQAYSQNAQLSIQQQQMQIQQQMLQHHHQQQQQQQQQRTSLSSASQAPPRAFTPPGHHYSVQPPPMPGQSHYRHYSHGGEERR